MGNFWNKFPENPKNSEKILKNIKKIPTLVRRAENMKKVGNIWNKFPENPEKYWKFPRLYKTENFLFWNFPTVVKFFKTPIFQGAILRNFLFWKFSTIVKNERVPKNQKKSKKILKIIKKFPRSLERAENAKNAWEISEINFQKFQNIPKKF